MSTRFYMICFDVSDNRRLREISGQLENHGQRVQRSVFECWLTDAQLFQLKRRLAELIDPAEDHVRYYPLCGNDIRDILIDGPGAVTRDHTYTLL
jgi:CRISPR-associated protein Cas2